MSITDIFIKALGAVLAFVGFCLILSAVGVNLIGVAFGSPILSLVAGAFLLGAGIYIIRGGTISI